MLAILLTSGEVFGLDPALSIEQYTQRRWSLSEGFPQVSVNSIVQDHDGFLWIGTFGGLVRFDGVDVDIIDMHGQCSNRILALEVDRSGAIWIGAERSGLCVYRNGVVSEVPSKDGVGFGGIGQIVTRSQGGVLAATARGLVSINGGTFERFTIADGLTHENVISIAEHADGSVWVGNRTGLCILRGTVCEVPAWAEPFGEAIIDSIHHSDYGSSWIGSDAGLFWVRDGKLEKVLDTGGSRVRDIAEDRDGGIWIGLEPGGVRRILPKIESLTGIDRHTNDTVNELFEDREGNLWIGSAGDGLVRLGEGPAVGMTIFDGDEVLPLLPIIAEGGGRAWVGTRCGGLARIEPDGTRLIGAEQGFLEGCVWSLLKDEKGVLWIGTYGDGLYWMDPDESVTRAGGPDTKEKLVRALAEQDGRILIGTDAGLFRFDRAEHSFEIVEGTEALDIFFVDTDQTGAVWLGTGQGAHRIRDGVIEVIDSSRGLSNNFVRAIHVDERGVIWLGTYGGGLNRLEGDQLFTFGPKQGLTDPAVSRIIVDNQQRFWMSGNRGVTRVRRSELDAVARGERSIAVVDLFDATDGMPSTETNGGGQPAGSMDPDGKIWFPTLSGLAVFDAERERLNLLPPPVLITKVVVDGEEIPAKTEDLVLPSDARNLEIHYTAVSFNAPEKVRFRYRLDGFDDRWIEAGTRRTAYYPSIPSGKLKFRVIAANEDRLWNEQGATFELEMKPRYFTTWWFYALCLAALTLLFAIVTKMGTAAARARERTLQREVETRTAELERLAKLTDVINEAVTVEDVLDHLYQDLHDIIPYDRIGLALLDPERMVLRSIWSRGESEPVGIAEGYEAPLAGSSLETILESGRPRIIDDLEEYGEEHPASVSTQKILSEGIRSNLTCPLKALGRPVGFVFFSSHLPNSYDETHVSFLQKIAGQLSLIIGKSMLYEDVLATKDDLEKANELLEKLAAVDGLTGLANRRSFDERLDVEWRRALRSNHSLSLLLVDVDHFKAYNDRYGHAMGDDVLRAISQNLSASVRRASDLPARYGGEEFVIILPDTSHELALDMAEKLRFTIEMLQIEHEGADSHVVTISAGVATTLPRIDDQPRELLIRADEALYQAKRDGRNRVRSSGETAPK